MALIPQDPKQQRALAVGLVAIVLFYLFWSFYHSPRVEELTAQQERLESLERRNQTARNQAIRGREELQQRAEEYERHVRRLEELIPASEEVAELLNTITLEARRLGITVIDFLPQPDEPGEHYTRHSYSLQVVGDYHQVGEFLTGIASLSRIITPVRLDLVPYESGAPSLGDYRAPVTATFEIETFILPDPSGLPAPEMGGEGDQQLTAGGD